jgi:prophage antirepressor-like protein/predicted GIY-YIG superfamily endonuclease
MFSQANFNIHKYGQKFCLNDIVTQCEISTNPKEYIKKIDDKTLYKSNYYINKKNLINLLCKSKAPKAKELWELLNKKATKQNKENTIEYTNKVEINTENNKKIVNFVDCGKYMINFNGKYIKYFSVTDKLFFKGKDVAEILEYVDTKKAINTHVRNQNKFSLEMLFKGEVKTLPLSKSNELTSAKLLLGNEDSQTIFINEAGLYSLIMASKKEEAIKFQDWVTSDVLPSIRKNGYYEIIKPHAYLKDDLENYKDKNCVYILNVKDDIYKYGQSHKLSNRLGEHVRKLDYINIIRIYEMDSINDILNLENKIKNLTKELKINITYNSGIEFFKISNIIKLNHMLDQIDLMSNEIKQNNKLLNNQLKIENLTLIEIEKTKQAEIDYLKTTKTLELQNENLKLQIELLTLQHNQSHTNIDKPKSLIQHILDSKINNNDQVNSTQIINSNITINELNEPNNKNKSCLDCGCDIYFTSIRCGKCKNKKRLLDSLANNSRPSLAQLEADLQTEKSYVQVGKKYGVSDNCIRKWINKYKSLI